MIKKLQLRQKNSKICKLSGDGCKTCPVGWCIAEYAGALCCSLRRLYGVHADPRTNGDVIREMSNAELAELLSKPDWPYWHGCVMCSEYQHLDGSDGIPREYKCDRQCHKHCNEWLDELWDPGIEVSS